MNTDAMEVDPLGYRQYNAFHPPFHLQPNILHTQPNIPHTLPNNTQSNIPLAQPNIPDTQPNISNTQPIPYPYKDYYPQLPYNNTPNQPSQTTIIAHTNQYLNMPEEATDPATEPVPEDEDIKPDISKIKLKKPKRLKGKTSSYWNKKVTDKDFKFYGCSVCNIAFQDLTELDSHVTMHTNRVTSYDIRVQNQKKKKRLKKEKKKKKKEAKIKSEFELEIKPEDGYIGTDKVADFNNKNDIEMKDSKEGVKDDKDLIDLKDLTDQNNANEVNQKDLVNKEEVERKDLVNKEEVERKDLVNKDEAERKDVDNQNLDSQKDAVYKCFACHKKFALSYYLKIHVRSHTDEKPYICNYCGQGFITASKLGRHNKRIHLSVRHQCRICYKFYNRFELLTKHFDVKHAEQKLEGEPYDYNAILPYLTELEEQLKVEDVTKKPKTEDIWGDVPMAARGDDKAEGPLDELKVEFEKVEKEEEKEIPVTSYKIEEIEVKCELEEETEMSSTEACEETLEQTFEQSSDDDEKGVKAEKGVKEEMAPSDDDEEYFPPGGWARSPPPASPIRPESPPKRKGGTGVCELCNRSFSSRSYLKVHMRTHTGEKPFACYICGRGFITANKMHRHVLTHDETWVGENCIKPETADIKSETEEDDKGSKKLKKGGKVEKAKNKILKKLNQKMDPKLKVGRSWQHRCEYCDKKFLHSETLQVHKKSHEGEELIIKCHYCLEPQVDQDSKEAHEQTHVGQKKPYLCTLCGRYYKNLAAMVYHRRNHKADSEKPYICDICSKRFDSHAKLARHIPTHSTEKFVLRYECPVCANMFHTRWHVQMHLKSHQKEGLILEENRNAVLAMVLQNARKIPAGPPGGQTLAQLPAPTPAGDERSRICNICGEVFQHFFYLEEHLKTHGNKIAVHDLEEEDEKKYTCQVCSKSFKLHYYLKLHSFTHTKEKPFICQQCGKGFITKGKLKRHLETHQGLKKYQCHICCKFFTRPSYMRIHIRTIHGTQDYNFRDYGIGIPVGLGVAAGLGVPLGQITENSMI